MQATLKRSLLDFALRLLLVFAGDSTQAAVGHSRRVLLVSVSILGALNTHCVLPFNLDPFFLLVYFPQYFQYCSSVISQFWRNRVHPLDWGVVCRARPPLTSVKNLAGRPGNARCHFHTPMACSSSCERPADQAAQPLPGVTQQPASQSVGGVAAQPPAQPGDFSSDSFKKK